MRRLGDFAASRHPKSRPRYQASCRSIGREARTSWSAAQRHLAYPRGRHLDLVISLSALEA